MKLALNIQFSFIYSYLCIFILVNCVGERPWWPYKASTIEERRNRRAKRRERPDPVYISCV